MKTFNLLILSILALFLSSCRSIQRQETKSSETKQEVITEKKTEYKDTILYTPKSETSINVPISAILEKDFNNELKNLSKDFKPKIISQKNGNATAKIIIEKDTIKVKAECDSIALSAKIRQDFERQYQNHSTQITAEKKEKPKSILDEILFWIALMGIGFCGGILVGVGNKL